MSSSIQKILEQTRLEVTLDAHTISKIKFLFKENLESLRLGFFLLDSLDSIDVVAMFLSVDSEEKLYISEQIADETAFIICILEEKSYTPWIQSLVEPLTALLSQFLEDVEPQEVEPYILDLFTPLDVLISGSTLQFSMGNPDTQAHNIEKPVHQVQLSPFWISSTEVSQALYWKIMQKNPSKVVGLSRPVENISWFDAVAFCNALSDSIGYDRSYDIDGENIVWIKNNNGFRLPTEAEWECAAMAGQDPSVSLEQKAWSDTDWDGSSQAIMQLHPNTMGIYDMIGNVSEWCWDWFGHYSSQNQTNPTGCDSSTTKVHRGGGWSSMEKQLSIHARAGISPHISIPSIGLRLCRNT